MKNKELYDTSKDPNEQNDVADRHPEVIAKLRQAYDAWWSKTLSLMINEEDAPFAPSQPQAVRYEKQLKQRGIPKWNPPKLSDQP